MEMQPEYKADPASFADLPDFDASMHYVGQHAAELSRERGASTAGFVVKALAGAVIGAAVAVPAVAFHNNRFRVEGNAVGSKITTKTLVIKETEFTPFTFQVIDASGSRIVFDRTAFGKSIPNASSAVVMDKYVVPGRTGLIDGAKSAKLVTVSSGQAAPGAAYKPLTIQVPIEQLATEFTKPDETINKVYIKHDDGINAFLGANDVAKPLLKAPLKAACAVIAAASSNDAGKCSDIIENMPFMGNDRGKDEATLTATGKKTVDDFIRQECGTVNWPVTKVYIEQFYKKQAVESAGGDKAAADAVKVVFTKNGFPTTDMPQFRDPTTEELAKIGFVPSEAAMSMTIKYPNGAPNFTCTPARLPETATANTTSPTASPTSTGASG